MPRDARRSTTWPTVLPNGLDTPNQTIWVLEANGVAVGRLWLGVREIDERTILFVWDVEIDAEHRGMGLGRAAMRLVEERPEPGV